jgi:hypothetical protein
MTPEQKIIRAKVGLLELAKQLGNVGRAGKMMGYRHLVDVWPRPAKPGQVKLVGPNLLAIPSRSGE